MTTTYTRIVRRLWLNSVKLAKTSREWKHYIHLTEVLAESPKWRKHYRKYEAAIERAGAAYDALLPSMALVEQYARALVAGKQVR